MRPIILLCFPTEHDNFLYTDKLASFHPNNSHWQVGRFYDLMCPQEICITFLVFLWMNCLMWIFTKVKWPGFALKPRWRWPLPHTIRGTGRFTYMNGWCLSSWWFQPIWKILYSQNGNLPQIGVKIKKYLKPPPSHDGTCRETYQSHGSYGYLLGGDMTWPHYNSPM